MKTMILKCALTLAVVVSTGMTAMADPTRRVIVQVPFAFVAGSVRLPAGQYTVTQNDAEKAVYITNVQSGVSIVALSEADVANTGGTQTSVNFVKVGNEYFMKVVRIAGSQGFLMHTSR